MAESRLLSYQFGQFGNYGSIFCLSVDNETGICRVQLTNHAYGDTDASVSAYVSKEQVKDFVNKLQQSLESDTDARAIDVSPPVCHAKCLICRDT